MAPGGEALGGFDMAIVGEKLVKDLAVGDTIAIQSQHEPIGYSVHTIERVDCEGPFVHLLGSNLLEMALYPDQLISLAK
jgi:hypothetical protein